MACTRCSRPADWLWEPGGHRVGDAVVRVVDPGEALCMGCYHLRRQARPVPDDLPARARALAALR